MGMDRQKYLRTSPRRPWGSFDIIGKQQDPSAGNRKVIHNTGVISDKYIAGIQDFISVIFCWGKDGITPRGIRIQLALNKWMELYQKNLPVGQLLIDTA